MNKHPPEPHPYVANADGSKITISLHAWDAEMVARCKSLGLEMKWSRAYKHWWLPDNLMNRTIFNAVFPEIEPLDIPADEYQADHYEPPRYCMDHQKEALRFAMHEPRHLFAHDTGTGKTIIGLELVQQKRLKTLVVCPLSIIDEAWMQDIRRFAPRLRAADLWKAWQKKKPSKFKEVVKWMDVGIINFESFKTAARYLAGSVQMVLVDESSKIKNHKTQITKALTDFCDNVKYVYLFSGTPAPNSRQEYFSQARIIDPCVFGRSFYRFRNRYYESTGYGGFTYYAKKHMEPDLMERISRFSSVVEKADVLDLPEQTFNVRSVHLGKDELKAYAQMKNQLVAYVNNKEITAQTAAVKAMKLREITSGFLIDEDSQVHSFGTSKLAALEELLDEIGKHRVIIWSQFIFEANLIAARLDKRGSAYGIMNGSTRKADRSGIVTAFKHGDLQYLVAHPATMAHGFTLTECTYMVYFSISYSHEEHKQSMDRIFRRGQSSACTYYYLLAPASVDTVIYSALKQKKKTERAVLDYIKGSRAANDLWTSLKGEENGQ